MSIDKYDHTDSFQLPKISAQLLPLKMYHTSSIYSVSATIYDTSYHIDIRS